MKKKRTHTALGQALRELRIEAGLSRAELARRLHAKPSEISELEKGFNARLSVLITVCEGLDCSFTELAERINRLNQPRMKR